MSQARYIVGDVHDVLATLPDDSVDLVFTSPPFLALRSYLPADHPDKGKEIGSERTPADFLDALLDVVETCARVLAPHGTLCFELGDTYAGNNVSGWERLGARAEQDDQPPNYRRPGSSSGSTATGPGWPLDKSLTCIPALFEASLAYGRNLLRPERVTPRWRVRNFSPWCLDGDTVVYARTPKGEGPTRLLHLTQNWQPGQWGLWDGDRWAPVLGWSTSEATDAIEIEFRNGERVSATREHEWPTQRGLVRTDELAIGDVVPSVRLPEPARPGWQPTALPDEEIGWLVGMFLAEGSFDSRDRIQISGHTDEGPVRLARLERLAAAYDGTATSHDYGNEGVVVVRSPVLAAVLRRYLGGDTARNKCLRAAAWRRSDAFLRAVLDGYLAGDGHYDAKNDRWRLGFTDNRWLARDLRTLCARIGAVCRIKRSPRAADPRGDRFAGMARFVHRGTVRLDGLGFKPNGEIVGLRPSKRRRFFDISVENEPHLFALASGILTHNCRPNPPVGALGDKFRPATSFVTVACKSRDRWFDLEAVRQPYSENSHARMPAGSGPRDNDTKTSPDGNRETLAIKNNDGNGAPPLDWLLIPTQPYRGSHYATFPSALVAPFVKSMCPTRVCRECGGPSRRIVDVCTLDSYRGSTRPQTVRAVVLADEHGLTDAHIAAIRAFGTSDVGQAVILNNGAGKNTDEVKRLAAEAKNVLGGYFREFVMNTNTTRGSSWTDCGHDAWRPGVVLDPFAGSGTTLMVATGHGRDAIGIDIDERNAGLAEERIGRMFLQVEHHHEEPSLARVVDDTPAV